MFLEEESISLLTQLGFNTPQAKVYLALSKLEEAEAGTLSKEVNVPRPEVYRTLGELQKKGLVEKVITTPYRFKATPIEFGLQILVDRRVQQCKEIEQKTKEFLRKIQRCPIGKPQKNEYSLIMVEGRERLLQIMKREQDNVQESVDFVSTLKRWLQMLNSCFETCEKALERNVRYRVVLERHRGGIDFSENFKTLLEKPNFKLRTTTASLDTNGAVFDRKVATFNFLPSKSIEESPLIWTDHPSFILMCQDHFDKIWETAEEYKLESKNN